MLRTLIVSTEKRFNINKENKIVNEDNTRTYNFWKRYLTVFDNIIIVARIDRTNVIDTDNYVESSRIKVYPLTNFQGPREGVLALPKIKKEIRELVKLYKTCSFILRSPGSIANIIGKHLSKHNLAYSMEVVGDPYDVFKAQNSLLSDIIAVKERRSLRKLLKNAQSASYVTQYSLQKRYPFKGEFQTYYSSIDLDKSFFASSKEYKEPKLQLIGVGNLEVKYKGVDYLLESLKVLKSKKIQFHLTWIGGGRLLSEYNVYIKENNLQDQIDLIGSIPHGEIPTYLSKNNVFILPSLQEGLPRALIEGMASRLICISTDVGGVNELINSDCIIPAGDSKALTRKLIEVNNNFDSFLSYTENNYAKAKEYLPEVLESRRNKFYQTIIDGN